MDSINYMKIYRQYPAYDSQDMMDEEYKIFLVLL